MIKYVIKSLILLCKKSTLLFAVFVSTSENDFNWAGLFFFVFRTDDRSILVDLFRSSSNSFRLFLSPFVRKSFNVSAKIRYTGKCQTNSLKYNRLNESDSSFYVKSIYVLCKAVSTLFQSINQ